MDLGRHQHSLSQDDYSWFVDEEPETQQGVFTYPGSYSRSVGQSYGLWLGLQMPREMPPGTNSNNIINIL